MKKLPNGYWLLFFLVVSLTQPAWSQDGRSFKVISYNILDGFDLGKDKKREAAMIQWLKEQNADVIGFQELNNFTQEKLEVFAKKYGHPYAILLKEDGYPTGITSKTPLELKTKMKGGLWHGMLHAKTAEIDFLVIHLSPHDWKFRRREADVILDYVENTLLKTGQENFMIMGDFNAHSPFDVEFDLVNPESLKLSRQADSVRFSQKGVQAYQTLRDGEIDYSVMARFLSFPLLDVVQKFVPSGKRKSSPTRLSGESFFNEKYNQKRIDYILVSPFLEKKCIDAAVINYGKPEVLSDHFPVLAIFRRN
jgi:exodeoxyribonuclease III